MSGVTTHGKRQVLKLCAALAGFLAVWSVQADTIHRPLYALERESEPCRGLPEARMVPEHFADVRGLMKQALEEKLCTGMVLLVRHRGREVFHEPMGTVGGPGTAAVGRDTLFDLASLTKVLAVTPCWMLLAAESPGIPDRPLRHWFPHAAPDKLEITPRLLLAHASGLRAWWPYYLHFYAGAQGVDLVGKLFGEQLEYVPGRGCVYSDVGFILLGLILETETGMSLPDPAKTKVFDPLGIGSEILFRPNPLTQSIALTRPGETPGLVHDLNCRYMGGATGHAGLFGTARAVAAIAAEILAAPSGGSALFDKDCAREFATKPNYVPGCTRALGFDTPSPEGSSSGRYFSPRSLGHTGFTGTSLWIDPDEDLVVVLLTNRVFMGESDQRIKFFRPTLHDAVFRAIRGD